MGLIEFLKVLLIGAVEGITEWLPISSTGHMLLLDAVMPLQMSEQFKEMFFVVIQLGAILAVVIMFWKKLTNRALWGGVLIGTLPAAVLGVLLDDLLEQYFGQAFSIAVMLIVYGVLFIWVESRNQYSLPRFTDITQIGWKTALAIGLFQALSLIPGTSRSGATVLGALLLGLSRTAAAEFSFFLAVPAMLGASALKLFKHGLVFTAPELTALFVGMAAAFLVSMLAIRFLMNYVKTHDFKVFGWYRIVLGVIVLLFLVRLG